MRIRAVMGSGWEIDDGENVRSGCCRMDCCGAGCTEEECDAAYESSIGVREGIWIECPRPRTKSEAIEALTRERDVILGACVKAIAYDEAIRSCADDPKKMASFCTAEGESLDSLYAAWITAARGAVALVEKVKGEG